MRLIIVLFISFITQISFGQTWTNGSGDNNFSTAANWSNGNVPTDTYSAIINSSGNNKSVINSVIVAVPNSLRVGIDGSGELNIEEGGVLVTTSVSGNCLVGYRSGDVGIINQNNGAVIISSDIKIGQSGTGTWNLNNGVVKATRGSFHLGGGNGTFKIAGGELQTRTGIYVYNGGNFIVDGSGADYISLGSNGTVDGFWNQANGSKLSFNMDIWGATPIDVEYVDGGGTGGSVTFANGALLDIQFKSGVNISGSWDVMTWDGTLTDNGLAFASTVDQSRWSFSFVDTDGNNSPDVLRLTATGNGTCTSNGVPFTWYDSYGLTGDYETLDTIDSDGDGVSNLLEFRSKSNPTDNGLVDNINDLKKYMVHDGVTVKMSPGTYTVTQEDIINNVYKSVPGLYSEYQFLPFEGSNSTYDFTGVTIEFSAYNYSFPGNNGNRSSGFRTIHLMGSNNHIFGLEFTEVDDNYSSTYKSILSGGVTVEIDGHNNLFDHISFTTRGSFPYGYGSYFGIGGNNTINHKKHSGLLVKGDNNTIRDVSLFQRTFGHGLFVQGGSNTIFDGCYVEGELRTTDDMLKEISGPAYDIDFLTTTGDRLRPGFMSSLSEDGIRAYASASNYFTGESMSTNKITVKNCTIKNMRRGVHTNFTPGNNTITGCTILGVQELGFILGKGDVVSDSKGDALYSPLLFSYYTSIQNTKVDLKIIRRDPSEYYGNDIIAYIAGSNNNITISEESNCEEHDDFGRILISGFNGADRIGTSKQYVSGSNNAFVNNTRYIVEIGDNASNAIVTSTSSVTDNGSGSTIIENDFVAFNCCGAYSDILKIEAEAYCEMSGVQSESSNEGGLNIGYLNDGDWTMYGDIDFTDQQSVNVRFGTPNDGGSIEFRLDSVDGILIGTMDIPVTGGWQIWLSKSVTISSISGVHNLYLVFKGGDSHVYNLDWFGLSMDNALAITSNELKDKLIFPNPIETDFQITGYLGAKFEVYSTLGNKLFSGEVSGDRYNVTMDIYPSGVYFLKIMDNGKEYITKLIKK